MFIPPPAWTLSLPPPISLPHGETLEKIEEEKMDEKRSLSRAKVKAHRDSLEGYVTSPSGKGG